MTKTITIKLDKKSENLEMVIRDMVKLYKEEVTSFTITEQGRKPRK